MTKFEQAASQISPDIYQRFKQALELGRWPDGRMLSAEQKEICMQAVLLYEATHQIAEQQRVGYIDRSKKTAPCGSDKSGHDHNNDDDDHDDHDDDVAPVRILH